MPKLETSNYISVFLEILKAGLWGHDVSFLSLESIETKAVFRLAQEQAVVGLVAAGINYAKGVKLSKEIALSVVGKALLLEKRNVAMNAFIYQLVEKMQEEGIQPILVKGQGVAQCYEQPLWRACGDVDFLIDKQNLEKAKVFYTENIG